MKINKNTFYWLLTMLIVLAIVIFLFLVIFRSSGWMGNLSFMSDESLELVRTQRILDGQTIYKDFHSDSPFFNYYILAVILRIFGDSYLVVQIAKFILALAITFLIYKMSDQLIKKRWSWLPAVFFVFFAFPSWPYWSFHWTVLFLFLLMIYYLFKYANSHKDVYLWLAAIISGLLFLCLYTVGMLTWLALGVWFLFVGRTTVAVNKKQLAIFFLIAFFVAVSGFLIISLLVGDWRQIYTQLLASNLSSKPIFNGLFRISELIYLIIVFLLSWLSSRLIKQNDNSILKSKLYLLLYSSIALWISTIYFFEETHVNLIIAPFIIMVIWSIIESFGIVIINIKRPLNNTWGYVCSIVGLVIFVGWILGMAKVDYSYLSPYLFRSDWYPVETVKGTIYLNKNISNHVIINELFNNRQYYKKDQTFIYPFAPGIYYFLGWKNPTKYEEVVANFLSQDQMNELQNELLNNAPVVVRECCGTGPAQPLVDFVKNSYSLQKKELVASGSSEVEDAEEKYYEIYERKD